MENVRQGLGVTLVVACGCLLSCHRNPAVLRDELLANGRWTGENACVSVTETGCDLVVGCGHGVFPRPTIRADGTFDVDGTYRVEIGPIAVDPVPPAHFSGSVGNSKLIVTVIPGGSIPAATYSMTPASPGTCPNPCA